MINTVNVILLTDESSVMKMASFEESQEGNQEAEKVFLELIEENFPGTLEGRDDLRELYLSEGYMESGGFTILLVHSTEI
ncbi:hypothetical protein HN499_05995 [archaeon]|nr:hypothetical protein [archaeon]